jgi:hypothetical protein
MVVASNKKLKRNHHTPDDTTSGSVDTITKTKHSCHPKNNTDIHNYPTSTSEYQQRLQQQKKEIYKNPPILPSPPAQIFYHDYNNKMEEYDPSLLPRRITKTGRLHFVPSEKQFVYYETHKELLPTSSSSINKHNMMAKTKEATIDPSTRRILQDIFQQFQPNVTPAEIIRDGAFGGTYFRPIISAVTNQKYKSKDVLDATLEVDWITSSEIHIPTMLTSTTYRESINKYKKKCGGSLGMWESSGWINTIDPYGWFQWYCRFYRGRRTTDDIRQIQRWMGVAGPKGRFKAQLCNKIYTACPKGTKINDCTISPVIRQTLFHWGLIIQPDVLQSHIRTMKLK